MFDRFLFIHTFFNSLFIFLLLYYCYYLYCYYCYYSRTDLPHNDLPTESTIELQYNDYSSLSPLINRSNSKSSKHERKRDRTSFKPHQIRTMKTYYTHNTNPDSKELINLSQKIGLPKRVLQVYI